MDKQTIIKNRASTQLYSFNNSLDIKEYFVLIRR